LESFARAQKGVYGLLSLSERAVAAAQLPSVQLIDMRQEYLESSEMMISSSLQTALNECLERGEQAVLLLNRRGYSNFMQCRECGEVVDCPNCDVSMTYHKSSHSLRCHYCSHEVPVPHHCPTCGSGEVRFYGTGTQKIEEHLQQLFPSVGILRMDVDTTSKKGSHQQLIEAFERGEAQILIGTQMVGKGLDFPRVTLVGVLAADLMLHLSDFRAGERTFQLLTQVAGRAGRHDLPGRVLVQTYTPEHFVMKRVLEQDYVGFYREEMQLRRQFSYPPYYFMAAVILTSEDYDRLLTSCSQVNSYLRQYLGASLISGPAMPNVGRVNNRFRMYFMIKYKQEPNLRQVLGALLPHFQEGPVGLSLDYYPNQLA
jgi:primosomal protein N' (replication factor Y)